jgi:hypothetical protein
MAGAFWDDRIRVAHQMGYFRRHSVDGGGQCVRLTRKLAERIDGIDLSHSHVGDVLCLPWRDAALIVAEGWAERISAFDRAEAHDRPRSKPRR